MNSGTPDRSRAPSRKLVRGVMALVIVGVAVGVYVLRPAAGEDQASPAAAAEATASGRGNGRNVGDPCRASSTWAPTSASPAR
jgi:hypothetical protein